MNRLIWIFNVCKCVFEFSLMEFPGFTLLSLWLLTLYRPMDFSLKFDTDKSGWSIVYIGWSQVIISKNKYCISLMMDFVLPDSTDLDEMLCSAAFHLGLHCLPK